MSMAMYVPDRAVDEADLRLKIFRQDESMSLSKILPHLSLLGVDVIDERPYELELGADRRAFIYDFGLTVPGRRRGRPVPLVDRRPGSSSWTRSPRRTAD